MKPVSSNPRPFGLESSTLPLSHCAPKIKPDVISAVATSLKGNAYADLYSGSRDLSFDIISSKITEKASNKA